MIADNGPMELRQLKYFVTVAEELHFGRAAERLHIVQPAVSQQVRKLERELGVDLFDRNPRTVRLTTAGQLFLPEARAVLAAAGRATSAIASHLASSRGVLRLGTSDGLGESLDRILAGMAALVPGLRVQLISGSTQARLDQVRAHTLDATFVRGLAISPGIRLIPVWEEELAIAIPASHPLARSDVIDLADLAEMPLRLADRSQNASLHELVTTACRAVGFIPAFGQPSTNLQDNLATVGNSLNTWTVLYRAHVRQVSSSQVAVRRLSSRLAITTMIGVSETNPPWCLDELLSACDPSRPTVVR
jgi:DNA-binding transcriptional LysR family regulator